MHLVVHGYKSLHLSLLQRNQVETLHQTVMTPLQKYVLPNVACFIESVPATLKTIAKIKYIQCIVSFSIENYSNHKNIENDYQSIM